MTLIFLVANVTAVGSPDRAEHAILGTILAVRCFGFGLVKAVFVVGEPLRDVGTPS